MQITFKGVHVLYTFWDLYIFERVALKILQILYASLIIVINCRATADVNLLAIYIIISLTRMWADAQRDGRPAEYRWRPLFNAAKFG